MNHRKMIFALAAALALSGCGSHQAASKDTLDVPPPMEVAAPPDYKPQALDASLRQSALDELTNDCQDNNPFFRSNALEALSENAPDSASRPIMDALSDPEPSVRYAAAGAAAGEDGVSAAAGDGQ